MDPLAAGNPFVVFTFIAAPAVMTNAAAVMSLTTSNRLARAVDRGRALLVELSHPEPLPPELRDLHLREVEVARQRAELLIRALGAFQLSFGSFAAATLVALFGACLGLVAPRVVVVVTLFAVVGCMAVAIGGIVTGAGLVVRESRMAYTILREESAHVLRMLRRGP
ncbi:MAG: DUF2721 domain-containing protein [Gemmataceae bacterium]